MKYLGQTSVLSQAMSPCHWTLEPASQLARQSGQPLWVSGYQRSPLETGEKQKHPTNILLFSPPSPPLLILLRISEAQTEATCWGSNFAKLTFCFVAERPAGVIIVRRAWLCWYSRPAEYLERWSGDGEDLRLFGIGEMTQTLIVNLMTEILDRIRYLLFVKLQETLLRNINLNWNKFLYEDFPLNI